MKPTLISQERPFVPAVQPRPAFPWATVTGRDFGRSIAWARRQPANPVNAALRAQKAPAPAP